MTAADLLQKHTCEITEDLLPFYAQAQLEPPATVQNTAEYSAFADERKKETAFCFVEEHIKNCENCRNLLQMIMEDDKEQIRVPACGPAIRFRRKYQIRLVLGMAFAILTAAGILALLL